MLENVRAVRSTGVSLLRTSLVQLENATPDEASQALTVISSLFSNPNELPTQDRRRLQSILSGLLDKVI